MKIIEALMQPSIERIKNIYELLSREIGKEKAKRKIVDLLKRIF